jgi:PIN domain nuclease of toxin-antitoxin system
MITVAVADAHALIWYAAGPGRRIGRAARAIFERADRGQATVYVPTLALVEIAEAVRRGVRLEGGFSRWVRRLIASRGYVVADLNIDVVLEAEGLYAIPERGDRLIAATAIVQDCPLITRDPALVRIPSLTTVW